MKKRAIIATAVAFILLLAVVAAGLNVVFTVSYVDVTFVSFSQAGEKDAAELKEKLDAFVGKSTTFLDLSDVEETVEEYPCFRTDEIKKRFPNKIELTVSERREAFAFEREDGAFAILDEDGKYLYDREENVNRVGGKNILLEGFTLTTGDGGEVEGLYFQELLNVYSVFRETLVQPRANIVSVRLYRPASDPINDIFFIDMSEGVKIDVGNPARKTEEKARGVLESYLSLRDIERTYGSIAAEDRGDEINVEYSNRIYD